MKYKTEGHTRKHVLNVHQINKNQLKQNRNAYIHGPKITYTCRYVNVKFIVYREEQGIFFLF